MAEPILFPLTLKYSNEDYEKAYQHHSKLYTARIFHFFFLYMLLSLAISLAKNIYFWNSLLIFRTLLMTFMLVILVFTIKTQGKKSKLHLEFGFCFLVALIYFIHLKFFFPVLFDKLSSQSIFYMSAGLESLRVFLFISKINWMMVWATNMLLNYGQYNFMADSYVIESKGLFSFIFPLVLANTMPFLSFFMERSFKMLFYEHVSFDRTLKSYEELIRKILPDKIIIVDENFTQMLFCNEKVQQFFKNENNSQILNKIKNIGIGDTNENLYDFLRHNLKTAPKFHFQEFQSCLHSVLTNEECFFDVKVGRIDWQHSNAFLILMSDISAMQMVKKLKELDGYKDRLLATVSHDLRTPLNGLVGILDLLSEHIEERKSRKFLSIAKRCTNLLLFMINDILDFSQISNGKLRLVFSKCKITDLTKEVINLIKFQCQRKNLAFVLDIPRELTNQLLLCDFRRVQQVLLNLLSNALKFTTSGYIKLMVRRVQEKGECFISFAVEDTGLGIKAEDIPNLFQLFGMLDSQKGRNPTGVGLGLVISLYMVRMLSGDQNAKIEVESQYEKGSIFSFRLPLKIPEEEEINDEFGDGDQHISDYFKAHQSSLLFKNLKSFESTNPGSTTSGSPRNVHALLVDDDQINLFVIGKYLESFGLNYLTASNGKMAIDIILKEKTVNLLILDFYMPVMNGFEAAKKIRQLEKHNIMPKIPILGLSASTSMKDLDNCRQSGMDEYLIKPVSRKHMKEKLQTMLHISIGERESRGELGGSSLFGSEYKG